MFSSLYTDIQLTLSLVRRDYAVQFAGTSLGILWVLIQYAFQIAVFFLIFGVILGDALSGSGTRAEVLAAGTTDYLSYLLGGMALWLPLSEMLLRSCSILADNRSLVRRTNLGMRGFLRVPVYEGIIHYALLFVIVAGVSLMRGGLAWTAPLAFVFGCLVILGLRGWAFIFARVSVILKDISPLLRLLFQVLFWLTPIVYTADLAGRHAGWFRLNPLHGVLEGHRLLLYGSPADVTALAGNAALWLAPGIFAVLSAVVYRIAALRLESVAADQL